MISYYQKYIVCFCAIVLLSSIVKKGWTNLFHITILKMENSDAYDTQPELIGYSGTSHMCKKILGWLKAGAVATTVAFTFAYICLHYQICRSCLSHFFSRYTATVLPLNTTQSTHLLPFLIMFTHYCFHRPNGLQKNDRWPANSCCNLEHSHDLGFRFIDQEPGPSQGSIWYQGRFLWFKGILLSSVLWLIGSLEKDWWMKGYCLPDYCTGSHTWGCKCLLAYSRWSY